MGYLIPTWQTKSDSISDFRSAVQERMIHKAIGTGMAKDRYELVFEDLLPADLGLKSWDISLPQDSKVWIDHKIEPDRLIGIYKVIQLGKWSEIDAMVTKRNGYIVSYYSLAQLYIYGQEGFFNEPFIIGNSDEISIEIDGSNKSKEKLVLGGFVLYKIEIKK